MPEIMPVSMESYILLGACRLTSAHPRGSDISLPAVLGEHERSTSVRDGEAGGVEWTVGARLELVLQRTFIHVVDEVERTGAELDVDAAAAAAALLATVAAVPPLTP